MRILIVLHKAQKKGGMVLQHLKMSNEFKRKGHEVLVFSFDTYFASRNLFFNYLSIIKNLKNQIKNFSPSIILTSDPYFTSFLSLLVRRKSIPICLRVGARYHPFYAARIINKFAPEKTYNLLFFAINFILKQLDKLILKNLDLIIFNSKYLEKYYRNFTTNSVVIYNGVNEYSKLNKTINKPLKLIFVGRIEPRKSIELIINALIILNKMDQPFHFSIVGKTNQYQKYWVKISALISKNDLWKKITLFDEIPNEDLSKILVKNDILLFSSDERNFPMTEGLPNVILEGMANGLAIIATSVAGVPELISHENGFLVKSNSKEFAEKILFLMKNQEKLLKIKQKNIQKVVKNYTIQKTAELYISSFKKFID